MNRFAITLVTVVAAALMSLGTALAADFVWTTDSVDATRFIETDSAVVGSIDSGERLEVVFEEGARLRVKMPDAGVFGWVDAGKTTETDPAAAAPIDEAPAPEGDAPAPE
jgi:hypothetical protein